MTEWQMARLILHYRRRLPTTFQRYAIRQLLKTHGAKIKALTDESNKRLEKLTREIEI